MEQATQISAPSPAMVQECRLPSWPLAPYKRSSSPNGRGTGRAGRIFIITSPSQVESAIPYLNFDDFTRPISFGAAARPQGVTAAAFALASEEVAVVTSSITLIRVPSGEASLGESGDMGRRLTSMFLLWICMSATDCAPFSATGQSQILAAVRSVFCG